MQKAVLAIGVLVATSLVLLAFSPASSLPNGPLDFDQLQSQRLPAEATPRTAAGPTSQAPGGRGAVLPAYAPITGETARGSDREPAFARSAVLSKSQVQAAEVEETSEFDKTGEHYVPDEAANARAAWAKRWAQPFPGRQWGMEPHCEEGKASVRAPKMRSDWVEEVTNSIYSGVASLEGMEIGACQLPVRFPPKVHMQYLDMFSDADTLKSQCFLKEGARLPDVIDDAQTLGKVPSATLDIVLAAHVLEHMPDALGAIFNWLRILKPGGLAFIVIPDLCDLQNPFGERFRMVTRPSHFTSELWNLTAAESNFEMHSREHSVSLATLEALRKLSGLEQFHWDFTASKMPDLVSTTETRMPLEVGPEQMARREAELAKRPHNVHLHLWNVHSFRGMLEAARPHFRANGVPFHILSIESVGRTWLNMQELRVVLRRLTG